MASGQLENGIGAVRAFRAPDTPARGALSLTRERFFVVLLGYFGLHAFLRGLVSETAGIDDVDQVLRAQIWSWGYGPQPPLYTWLTKIFLGTFGYNIFSLTLLKESLIFGTYALVYASTRQLTRSHACALAATAMLQFNPSIAWESHRELTHTVLVSALSVATIYAFLKLDPNRWLTYCLLGICSGMGMLAKYNFAILYVAILLGALCVRELHSTIFNRKMLVALLITSVICAPHVFWVFQHHALAFSSVPKLKIVETSNAWGPVLTALSKWGIAILAHMGITLGLVLVLFWKRGCGFAVTLSPKEKLLCRMLGWILVIVTANIVVFRVTGIRDRYVQPLLVWLPILLVAALKERLSPWRVGTLLKLGAVAGGVILVVAPGRVVLTEWLGKSEVLNTPFRNLANDLKPRVEQVDCIIAENHTLAGNLRLWFANKLVIDPEVGPLFPPGPRDSVLIWRAPKNATPPVELLQFTRAFTGKYEIEDVKTCEELLKYHHERTIRLATSVVR